MLTGANQAVKIITQLQNNRKIFQSMLSGVDKNTIYWKPAADKWCLLEIVCHLFDEEREDFRARVAHALENPERPLKPIDPQGWVTKRQYLDKNYQEIVLKFLDARDESVSWLKSLQSPSWDNSLKHPQLGTMSARKFLVNWLAHDYHHIRQINRLNYEYLRQHSGDDLGYAGKW